MASQQPGLELTCLICFKSRPLKTVGNCKHSFCTECLSTVLESLETGSVTFACPSCKVDCPRPQDGVQGLVDFIGGTDTVSVADTQSTVEKDDIADNVICDLCSHKQRQVKASNTCAECDHLNICKDCSKTHCLNNFTRSHLLTPIAKRNKKELSCEPHDKMFNCFCKTCQEPVCMVCVSLNHGDHEVERLADVIRSKEAEVKVTLGVKAKKLKELQRLKRELMLMKSMATEVDTRDKLIKEIEDHAQKLLDQIIKWKDDLKKEVTNEFQVVRDIPVYLEKVSETVQDLQKTVNRANQVQGDCAENHPVYLDKLVNLLQELAPAGETRDEIQVKELQNQLLDLKRNDCSFLSESGQASYGKINITAKEYMRLDQHDQQHIFEQTMTADSKDMFIPCVAVLSPTFFAVAHPVKSGELSVAIDIYEFPGTLKRTLKDHVPPIYDMSSTPSGHLVVLSGVAEGGSCNVKGFDPENGYISSTRDIEFAKPLSLGVTMHGQYVILGINDQGQSQITVADEDGVVELQQVLDGISNPKRITCGWRHVFVSADRKIITYEINNSKTPKTIQQVAGMEYSQTTDITATQWDNLFIAWTGRYVALSLYQEESFKGSNRLHDKPKGGDMEARISTKDGQHVVISHGRTIKVVKYSYKA